MRLEPDDMTDNNKREKRRRTDRLRAKKRIRSGRRKVIHYFAPKSVQTFIFPIIFARGDEVCLAILSNKQQGLRKRTRTLREMVC